MQLECRKGGGGTNVYSDCEGGREKGKVFFAIMLEEEATRKMDQQ